MNLTEAYRAENFIIRPRSMFGREKGAKGLVLQVVCHSAIPTVWYLQ